MFHIQNVPIVVEPGVAAIEAEFLVDDRPKKNRAFPVRLHRLDIDEVKLGDLPFIPSTRFPHVFSLTQSVPESLVLLVYDAMGRIDTVYIRDKTGKAWDKKNVADEHAGKFIKQFSIRYFFTSEKSRDEFMSCVDNIVEAIGRGDEPPAKSVKLAFSLLSRARTGPVLLPVAVAKTNLKGVKI